VLTEDQLAKNVLFETCRLLSESVVWLYANNRVSEAEQIIRNAAKLNNITMPDEILVHPEINVTVNSEMKDENSNESIRHKTVKLPNNLHNQNNSRRSQKTEDRSARYTILDIFRNRHLTINIFCMAFMWLVKLFKCFQLHT